MVREWKENMTQEECRHLSTITLKYPALQLLNGPLCDAQGC